MLRLQFLDAVLDPSVEDHLKVAMDFVAAYLRQPAIGVERGREAGEVGCPVFLLLSDAVDELDHHVERLPPRVVRKFRGHRARSRQVSELVRPQMVERAAAQNRQSPVVGDFTGPAAEHRGIPYQGFGPPGHVALEIVEADLVFSIRLIIVRDRIDGDVTVHVSDLSVYVRFVHGDIVHTWPSAVHWPAP
ncbi:hypothetical protein [Nonomuraea salmonea]|uniref:hypothetical protein n=1 Tax=Nonomuraea salmonea TaxID=46181 RepID=UPI0031EF1D95